MENPLDVIFPKTPNPIEIQPQKKGETETMIFKMLVGVGLIIAAGFAGFVILDKLEYSDNDVMAIATIKGKNNELEVAALRSIRKYCFPLNKSSQDASTCSLWLEKYRDVYDQTTLSTDVAQAGNE